MSVPELSPGSVTSLTDKELEVLRLLAAGHTVKSIAARLERTEASINERLRDARRKTGIGSSRELARSLAAQKIWDKKIDLPPAGYSTEREGPSAIGGRSRSKGTLIMLLALPLAAAGLVLAGSSAHQVASAPPAQAGVRGVPPLVGEWSLDVARIPADERPRRVTMDFRVSPDGKWTTHVEIVQPDGATLHAESTASLDGVAAPVSGNMGNINTVSLRQPAPNTLVMTLGKDGAPISTRVYTVARDRQSMTETIVWAGDSVPKLETTYFNRID